MLKTYINTIPYTKFILITDSLEHRGNKLFDHIVDKHLNKKEHKIHYCVFEGVFKKNQEKFQSHSNIVLHNFVSEPEEVAESDDFEQVALRFSENTIVIINSLASAIFRYGLPGTYRLLNTLKNNKGIKQIISVLHKDLLQEDSGEVYFTNLSTLSISIEPNFYADGPPRLQYMYKKSGGKIISEIEEYKFEGEHLITNKIAKPDASKFLEKTMPKEINPEDLSTFRIRLTDEEKVSRDKLVLPYLPNANDETSQEEGKIFYQLDDVDDWDEEDPDDDLDI